MYEDSDSFRDDVSLRRYAINPTLTIASSARTRVTLAYEHLQDSRVADRGITSFVGSPADIDVSTYYGNPADSRVRAGVDLATATVEHEAGEITLRTRTLFGSYDRFYQQRQNIFNQTEVVYPLATGRVAHAARGHRAGPAEHGQLQEHRVLRRHGRGRHVGPLPAGPDEHARARPQRPHAHRADRRPAHPRLRAGTQRARQRRLADRGRVRLPGRPRHQRDDRRAPGRAGGPGPPSHLLALEPPAAPAPSRGGGGDPLPYRHVRGDRRHRRPAGVHAGGRRRLLRVDEGLAPAAQPRERLRHEVLAQRGPAPGAPCVSRSPRGSRSFDRRRPG